MRCCKTPLDERADLFKAVTGDDKHPSRAPVSPYFEACALAPSAFHHGNRGMTRDRIEAEFALFRHVRAEVAQRGSAYRSLGAPQAHAKLRAAVIGDFPWLAAPATPRIGRLENFGDWLKLALFVIAAVIVLSAPGLILVLAIWKTRYYVAFLIVAFIALAAKLKKIADIPPTPQAVNPLKLAPLVIAAWIPIAVFFGVYWLGLSALGTPFSMLLRGRTFWEAWSGMLTWIGLSLVSAPVSAVGVLVWLRTLERRDSSHDAPPVDPHFLREMARREDWIPQNHMGSIVLMKPGVLRAVLVRAGHLGLHLVLRVFARDGYLGSMRTIHFAHWAFVNNESRLLFFSNFDQTWESYLDDFIEKAHPGLTLAWSCGVGFPPARFMLFDGASRGRQFKEWARHSMAVSHFWYSAYKDLTAEQIERNFRIASGLRKPALTPTEAAAWLNDL